MNINCPRCKASQAMDESLFGKKWRCSECSQKIKVNKPAEPAPQPAPPAAAPKQEPKPARNSSRRKSSVRTVKKSSAAASARKPSPSRRSGARRDDQEVPEGDEQQPAVMAVSDDQAKYLIGSFVAVLLIFGFFVFTKGGNGKKKARPKKTHQVQTVAGTPLDAKRKALEKNPDDAMLMKEFSLMLVEQGGRRSDYMDALRLLKQAIAIEPDILSYTRAVEYSFLLEDAEGALELAQQAQLYDPVGCEDIKRLIGKDELKSGEAKRRAMAWPGMAEALEELKLGIEYSQKGQEDNSQFKAAQEHLRKALETFEMAQADDMYNLWLEKQMEKANKHLMWANKLYRNVSAEDRAYWKEK